MFGMISLKVKLPASIFSCMTLVLNLRGVNLNDLSHVVVDLPRLKTLHLSRVVFQRHQDIYKMSHSRGIAYKRYFTTCTCGCSAHTCFAEKLSILTEFD
jgi:hypothetical protein